MTFRKHIFALFAFAIFAFCTSANATLIHLVCRGGISGNTGLQVATMTDSDGTPLAKVQYTFERYTGSKSSVKADGSQLAPGQCSWSTGLLGSNQNYFKYTIHNANIYFQTYFVPTTTTVNGTLLQQSDHTNVVMFPDSDDPDQAWLPSFATYSTVTNDGSILDPDMIFHIYVSINSDNSLQFHNLNSAVEMY